MTCGTGASSCLGNDCDVREGKASEVKGALEGAARRDMRGAHEALKLLMSCGGVSQSVSGVSQSAGCMSAQVSVGAADSA